MYIIFGRENKLFNIKERALNSHNMFLFALIISEVWEVNKD